MSYLVPREVREAHSLAPAQSPSLESVLSEITELSREWVLFGPEASEPSERASSSRGDQFELPDHRLGDFDVATPAGSSTLDRVHQWSSEQSRLVFEELGRLEQRFLWHRQQHTHSEEPETPPSSGHLRKLASAVHNLIALDDEVLELIFASNQPGEPQQPGKKSAFAQSQNQVPHWDDEVVERALKRIGVRPTWWFLRLLCGNANAPKEQDPPTRFPGFPGFSQSGPNLWDEVSSMSTEVY